MDKGNNVLSIETLEQVSVDLSQPAVLAEDLGEDATAVSIAADCPPKMTKLANLPLLGNLLTELLVSITSAQSTVTPEDETCSKTNTVSATEDPAVPSSSLPPAKLQVEGDNPPNGGFVEANQPSELPKVTTPSTDDWRKRPRGHPGKNKLSSKSVAPEAKDKEAHPLKVTPLPKEDWRKRPRGRKMKNKPSSKSVALEDKDAHPLKVTSLPKDDWRTRPRLRRRYVQDKAKRVLRSAVKETEKENDMTEPPISPLKRKAAKEPGKAGETVASSAHPLKRRTDHWDLKAITTKCGSTLVPFNKRCDGEMTFEAALHVPQPMETETGSSLAVRMEKTKVGEKKSQNSEMRIDEKADDHNDLLNRSDCNKKSPDVNLVKVDGIASSTTEPTSSPERVTKRREFGALSFSKLKSVLFKAGKRKASLSAEEDQVKKSKADTNTEKSDCVKTSEPENLGTGVGSVPQSQQLDLDLARALGLAPKELKDATSKTQENTQLRKDHLKEVDPDATKTPQHPTSPNLLHTVMGRMRPLQKRGVSAETIKKKWWLHFLTSDRQAKTKPLQLQVDSSHSVRKGHSPQDRASGAEPSPDALTLLADLALGGSKEEVLPQPAPAALESEHGPSLKKGECLNSSSSPEQQSVLHGLLRRPTSRSGLPPMSSSIEGLEEGHEVLVLISTEHSYSLPPSSLPLGLPGALLGVSPLACSEELRLHRRTIYGDGTPAPRAFLCQEDMRKEEPEKPPEYPNSKSMTWRKKLRRSRHFLEKDGSIQVTRSWKEDYDFGPDSKFTNNTKEKAVNRALHGTWDFNTKETPDQIQLIIHMWIGLFYSRTTARSFQIDPSHTPTMSEACEALDLSKEGQKEAPLLGLRSEPLALDLSVKNADAMDLTLNRTKSREEPPAPHKESEVIKNVPISRDMVVDMSDKTKQLDNGEGSQSPSKKDGLHLQRLQNLCMSICDTTANVHIQDEGVAEAHGSLERSRDGQQNFSAVELVQPAERNRSSRTKACIEEEEARDDRHVGHTIHVEETQRRDHKESDPAEADPPASIVCTGSTTKKMATVDEDDRSSAETQPAVHVGKECIGKTDIEDGKNISNERDRPAHGIEIEEALPLVCDVSEPREKVSPDPCEKNSSREENPIAVANENVAMSRIPPLEEYHEKEPLHDLPFVAQRGNDSGDKPLHVLCDGPASIDEEQDGNGSSDKALPVEHAEDVRGAEIPSEMLDETKCIRDVPPENQTAAVCERINLSVGEPDTDNHQNKDLGETSGQVCESALKEANCSIFGDQGSKLLQGERKFDTDTASCQTFQHGQSRSRDESDAVERHSEDIEHTKVPHPQYEKSEAVKDQNEMPPSAVDSDMDVTDIERNPYTDISKLKVGVDSSMNITHSEIPYPQDLVQGHIHISQISKSIHIEDITGTHISPSCEVDETVKQRVEIPLIDCSREWIPQTMVIDTCSAQKESGDEANVISPDLFKICNESDKRCPTPTVDEIPYDYTSCSDSFNYSAVYGIDCARRVLNTGKDYARSSTPTQDELPFDQTQEARQTVLLSDSERSDKRNICSGLVLKEEQVHELDARKSPNPSEKQLQPNRDYQNNPKYVEQTTDPSLDSVSTNPSTNLHSIASGEGFHVHEHRLYASLSESLARHYDSSLRDEWTLEEAHLMRSNHREPHSDKTDRKACTEYHSNRASSSSVVSWEGDADSSTQSTCRSVADKVTSPDLSSPYYIEPRPYSQRPVMAVKPAICKKEQMKYPLTPDIPRALEVSVPACANTTVATPKTPFVTEIKKDLEDGFIGVSEGIHANEETDRNQVDQEAEWIPKDQQIVRTFNFSKSNSVSLDAFDQYQEWDTQENEVLDSNKPSTSTSGSFKSVEPRRSASQTQKDWYSYCQSEENEVKGNSWIDEDDEDFSVAMPSIVTVLDNKGNRVTYEHPIGQTSPNTHSRTTQNLNTTDSSHFLEEISKKWAQTDLTQSSMDQEYLIFSEKLNHMLKPYERKNATSHKAMSRLRLTRSTEKFSGGSPVTVHFTDLKELDSTDDNWETLPPLIGQRIKVAMPDGNDEAYVTGGEAHLHLQKLACAKGNKATHGKVSDMTFKSELSYKSTMMDEVCAVKKLPSKPEKNLEPDSNPSKSRSNNNNDESFKMQEEVKSVVRQPPRRAPRFFMLVTSADSFFKETKELLEAEGHCEIEPTQFFSDENCPLLIILRNEDIAEHICEVPHLLELKKSPAVQFAGIDQPEDVVNLTHQPVFTDGGFVVFEGAALEVLSLSNMKRMKCLMEKMTTSKKGKWKWMMHYRDSRLLKEQARLSPEVQERKRFLDSCQQAGIVEVLPYHDCDVISKERPNYLDCLVRLQVQNISARFPVFITDTTADNAFGKNGIMTMNINSFLLISQSDSCTVS